MSGVGGRDWGWAWADSAYMAVQEAGLSLPSQSHSTWLWHRHLLSPHARRLLPFLLPHTACLLGKGEGDGAFCRGDLYVIPMEGCLALSSVVRQGEKRGGERLVARWRWGTLGHLVLGGLDLPALLPSLCLFLHSISPPDVSFLCLLWKSPLPALLPCHACPLPL